MSAPNAAFQDQEVMSLAGHSQTWVIPRTDGCMWGGTKNQVIENQIFSRDGHQNIMFLIHHGRKHTVSATTPPHGLYMA